METASLHISSLMKTPSTSAPCKPSVVNLFACGLLLLLLSSMTAFAGSAAWKLTPTNGDWNTAANWTPMSVPNARVDTATFGKSNQTSISLSNDVYVSEILFSAGANGFKISTGPSVLSFAGAGVTNNSGSTQNFVVEGATYFLNAATAGSLTTFTYKGGQSSFSYTSSAASATFILESAVHNSGGANGSGMGFLNSSTAGDGTFFVNGGTGTGPYDFSIVRFFEGSTAGNATLTANGSSVVNGLGGFISFQPKSNAGAATLIANGGSGGGEGGSIVFDASSHGDTARVQVFSNGKLNISSHNAPGVIIGSLEGDGDVFLGANNLSVGADNLHTIFSGVIEDSGALTKIGTGKLTLSGANLYSGGTTIIRGRLLVNNTSGSGTGTGPVSVNAGALGGIGTIAGAVTVGNGSGGRALLAPGATATVPGRLTIQSGLTFNSDATYKIQIDSATAKADKVVANDVTINPGTQFIMEDLGAGTLAPGTVFTLINNTSASPIAGRFSNLADGLTLTNSGNTYRVNYQGGDGNDLTLTVQ